MKYYNAEVFLVFFIIILWFSWLRRELYEESTEFILIAGLLLTSNGGSGDKNKKKESAKKEYINKVYSDPDKYNGKYIYLDNYSKNSEKTMGIISKCLWILKRLIKIQLFIMKVSQ